MASRLVVLVISVLSFLAVGVIGVSCAAGKNGSINAAVIISSDDGSREESYPLQALPSMTSQNAIRKTFHVDSLRDATSANILMYAVLNDFTLEGQFGFDKWEWIFFNLNGHEWVVRPQDMDFERVHPFRPTWVNTKWRGVAIPDLRWLKTGENELTVWNNNLPGNPTNKFFDIGIDTNTKEGRSKALYKGEWSSNHLRGEAGKPINGWDSNLPADDGSVLEGEYMIRLELLKTPLSVAKKIRLVTDSTIRDAIARGGSLLVAEAEPTEKICPDKPFDARIPNKLRVDLAGGERECVQLVLWALSDDLKDVEIKVDGLSLKAGMSWDICRVGYVSLNGEMWPDPLFPTDNPISIASGKVQPVLITFAASETGAPGTYKGTVTVSAKGIPSKSIPIEIKRRKFNLSKPGSMPFVISLDYSNPAHSNLIERSRMTMFSCNGGSVGNPGMTLNGDGAVTCEWNAFKQKVKGFETDRKGSVLGLGWIMSWYGSTVNPGVKNASGEATTVNVDPAGDAASRARFDSIMSGYQTALSDIGWDTRSYFYVADEPGAAAADEAAKWAGWFKTAAPKLKTMITCDSIYPQWKGKVDAYCITTNAFRPDVTPAQVKDAGGELWLYTCTDLGRPSLTIPHNSGPVRYWPWLAMRHGVNGLLYWAVSYAEPNTPAAKQLDKPGLDGLGEGLLFYTTEDGRGLSSLRAEAVRDGLEDYEYLSRLTKYSDRKAQKLFNEAREVVPSGDPVMFPHSLSKLIDLRRRIGDYLDSKMK